MTGLRDETGDEFIRVVRDFRTVWPLPHPLPANLILVSRVLAERDEARAERDAAVARAEVAEAALARVEALAAEWEAEAPLVRFPSERALIRGQADAIRRALSGDTPTEPTGDEPRPEDCERAAAEQLAARLTAAGRPVLADTLLDWASKFAEPTGDESCTWQDEAACPVHAEPAAPTQDGDDPWAGIDRLDLLEDFEDGPR